MGNRKRSDAPVREELSDDVIVAHLSQLAEQRAQLQAQLDEVETQLHKTVILAFNRGVTVRPIMDATAWSKSRCYQIRDGRR